MQRSDQGRFWLDVFIFAAISVILFQFGLLKIFFVVPLHVIYKKRGDRGFLYSAGVLLIAVLIFIYFRSRRVPDVGLRKTLAFLQVFTAILLIGAVFFINRPWRRPLRRLYKTFVVCGAVGIVSIPVIIALNRSGILWDYYRSFISDTLDVIVGPLRTFPGAEGNELLGLIDDPGRITELLKGAILRSFLFYFFLAVIVNLRVGEGIGSRMYGGTVPRLVNFFMPARYFWILPVSWAGIILSLFIDFNFFAYTAWNAALIVSFLYTLQGIGIIQFFLQRAGLGRGVQTIITLGIVLIIPFVLLAALSLFGFSEVWGRYRSRHQKGKDPG
jgi:hypothetical protein